MTKARAAAPLLLLLSCHSTSGPMLTEIVVPGVAGATVNVVSFGADKAHAVSIGPLQTDLTGTALVLPPHALPTAPIIITATGGSYTDPATGEVLPLGSFTMTAMPPVGEALLPADPSVASVRFAVTPLTYAAATRATALGKANLIDNTRAASSAVARQFGLADINTVIPADATAPVRASRLDFRTEVMAAERQYGVVLAGFAQLAKELDVLPQDLASALALDASDGDLDGTDPGTPITVRTRSGGTVTLQPNAFTAQFQTSINHFVSGGRNAGYPATIISPQNLGIATGALWITTTIPACVSGSKITLQLSALGGTPPYTWSAANLPPTLAITPQGALTGTCPVTAGQSSTPAFTVTLKDSANNQTTLTVPGLVSVTPAPLLNLAKGVPQAGPQLTVGVNANAPLVTFDPQNPGSGPLYSYFYGSLSFGTEPPGLAINLTNGNIVGTPTRAGNYTFQVCMTDSNFAVACIPDPGEGVSVVVNPGANVGGFDGSYAGTATATGCSNGQPPTNGVALAFTISGSNVTGTKPVAMTGTVQSSGEISFSGADGLGGTISFSGTIANGAGSGTGADAAPNVTCQFRWNASKG